MPQHEYIPNGYFVEPINGESGGNSMIRLRSTGQGQEAPFRFTFEAIRPNLFRTTFFSDSHPLPPHPSAAPLSVNLQGINPQVSRSKSGSEVCFNLGDINATISWTQTPVVTLQWAEEPPIHRDLPYRSYAVDGPGVAHYTTYRKDTLH